MNMNQVDQFKETCDECQNQYNVTKTTSLEELTLNNKLHQIYCPHCKVLQPFLIIAASVTSRTDDQSEEFDSKLLLDDTELPYKVFRDRANDIIKEHMSKRNA
ncbi:hypothetical protein [Haloplasma contractile]|uniref:Uncharacterized protein n=1 Tax=Haloplasma contractile SSD-17B TaxID=1033810 RepID=U2E9K3_9MOLU|nr:hypothetical protein [Haloplasma contractile]ERJ11823.1 hypothetical protein HLPCO_002062 [Haloplasma contractile SSD-17B]